MGYLPRLRGVLRVLFGTRASRQLCEAGAVTSLIALDQTGSGAVRSLVLGSSQV